MVGRGGVLGEVFLQKNSPKQVRLFFRIRPIKNKKTRDGLSCSLALNGSADFLFASFVCSKESSFALCSFALEPDKAPLCWFSSTSIQQNKKGNSFCYFLFYGGQGWIRTTVVSRRQIYSLLPLATRAPTHYLCI